VKYTEGSGRIVITAASADGHVTLSVTDSGIGITEQTLPHVFDIFLQEPQASDRARGGLGLGLAIVRSLVEMHGGKVSAMSAGRGAGSTFTIRLPAVAEGAQKRSTSLPIPPPRTAPEGGKRVLIVDDNADAAEMLAMVMKKFGCETHIAHDGPSALALLATFQPELALLDIGLPGMDGYELAQKLRGHPNLANIRLVAVTGYAQKGHIDRAFAAGFDEHLVKPVDIKVLEALLSRLPARARAAAALTLGTDGGESAVIE
jgi:CheY-like chemotaxis protein